MIYSLHRLSEKLLGPATEQSPRIRKRFLAYNRRNQIYNSRVASFLVMVLMPAGSSLDYFVYPEFFWFFFKLRILSSFLAALCFGLLWTPRFSRRYYRFLSFSWFFIPTAFISLMIYYSEGSASPYYAGLNLVLVTVCWVAQVTFHESLVAFSTTLILYLVACFYHGPIHTQLFYNNLYFMVVMGITMVIGNFILNRLRLREFITRTLLDRSHHELESKNKQLMELDEAKSRFFANISHELRTPLTLIIAPIEHLLHVRREPELQTTLEMMKSNAFRLLKLINDLLDLARFDAGQQLLKPEKIDAASFVRGLIQSTSAYAEAKQINLQCHTPDRPLWILADPSHFEKGILNLAFNALKFTPANGRVTVSVLSNKHNVLVQVEDTGPGIAMEDQENIFDPFWQSDDDSTRKNQGAGLGLALVRQVSESHGGRVTLNSTPGSGSTFTIHWPRPTGADLSTSIARTPQHSSPPASEHTDLNDMYRRAEFFPLARKSPPTRNADPATPTDNPTVLVADDEPEMRSFLTQQLSVEYQVIEATNGRQAIDLAEKHHPSLILLDYMMPEMHGLEVCRHLRKKPDTTWIPIILLTARADEQTRLDVLKAGATDFLTKPFGISELLNRCHNLVGLRTAQLTVEKQRKRLEETLTLVKQTEAELVQAAKMSSLGQLSAGLLHEVNNPITFSLSATRALEKLPPEERAGEEYTEILSDLKTGLSRAARILTGLKRFAHPGGDEMKWTGLHEIITECSVFIRASLDLHHIILTNRIPKNLTLLCNRNQLEHYFLNLLQNAIDSLAEKSQSPPEGWKPCINIEWKSGKDSGILSVRDNGLGIPEDIRHRILDPFFTTKDVGAGLGLGLSIAYRIISHHNGHLTIQSTPKENCTFAVELPRNMWQLNTNLSYV